MESAIRMADLQPTPEAEELTPEEIGIQKELELLSAEELRIQKELEVIRSARMKLLTKNVVQYSIAGRTLTYQNPKDLISIEKSLMSQLRQVQRQKLITSGCPDPNKVYVRFSEC